MEIERNTGVQQTACWCTQEKIPPTLLERIAAVDVNRACICAACIKAASAT